MSLKDRMEWGLEDIPIVQGETSGGKLKVGDQVYLLGSAIRFDDFLNRIADLGHFPNLTMRSFYEGTIEVDYDGDVEFTRSGVDPLLRECEYIRDNLWDRLYNADMAIIDQLVSACLTAKEIGENIQALGV